MKIEFLVYINLYIYIVAVVVLVGFLKKKRAKSNLKMLENPTDSSSTPNIATVKRYAPPNQRNRSLGRRKSGGDRLDQVSSYGNDGDKNQTAAFRNVPIMDHAYPPQLIGLQGCGSSEAYQLLNNRWAAAMNLYEDPSTDLAERPVMYSGISASAWGQIRLPHRFNYKLRTCKN